MGFPGGTVVKNESLCQCRRCRFDPWVGKILWRRKWQPTPVFLLGKSFGQRSLLGYIPWAAKSWIWLNDRTCMHAWNFSFFLSPLFLVLHFFFSSGFRNSLCVRRLMTLFTIYIANVVSFFIICLLNLPIIFCHEKYFK